MSSLAPTSTAPWAVGSPSLPITQVSARPNKAVARLVSIEGSAIERIARVMAPRARSSAAVIRLPGPSHGRYHAASAGPRSVHWRARRSPPASGMALTIYGSPRSRTMRVLWIAEELGLAFRHVDIAFDDPALKSPWFLAVNPAGAIPAIEDDDVRLSESLTINLYLAKRYGAAEGGLYPPRPADEAQVWRWTLWAQGELEPWIMRDARLAAVRTALA